MPEWQETMIRFFRAVRDLPLKTATALAEANQRGERLSESEYQQVLGRLMRRETAIEILRENVARFKSWFRTH